MKFNSIPSRALRKVRRFIQLIISRMASFILPDRQVVYYLDRPFNICIPFFNMAQFRTQVSGLSNLKLLEDKFGTVSLTFVTLSEFNSDQELFSEISNIGGELSFVPDFRSMISFLAGANFYVVIADEILHNKEKLNVWCDSYHVKYYSNIVNLVTYLKARGPLKITGQYTATYALYKSLYLNVMCNQYAFQEELDWEIIKKLPNKFIEFRSSAKVHAHPMSLLTGPLLRIKRQRAVGELYKDYLNGESVLDIGCDVRGIEEFVGPNTSYKGIDMHGKPDIILNLDHDSLPFEDKSIDTVVCIETLEHLQNIHKVFDSVMKITRKYVICSLPVEAAYTGNKLVDSLGGVFSFSTPIAPVFDRHQWIGSIADNLDFIYYRGARNGFTIKRIDLFYMPNIWKGDQVSSVLSCFNKGNIANLNRQIGLIMFVLERKS